MILWWNEFRSFYPGIPKIWHKYWAPEIETQISNGKYHKKFNISIWMILLSFQIPGNSWKVQSGCILEILSSGGLRKNSIG